MCGRSASDTFSESISGRHLLSRRLPGGSWAGWGTGRGPRRAAFRPASDEKTPTPARGPPQPPAGTRRVSNAAAGPIAGRLGLPGPSRHSCAERCGRSASSALNPEFRFGVFLHVRGGSHPTTAVSTLTRRSELFHPRQCWTGPFLVENRPVPTIRRPLKPIAQLQVPVKVCGFESPWPRVPPRLLMPGMSMSVFMARRAVSSEDAILDPAWGHLAGR